MNVRVKFLGGAQTVTGSRFLLEIDHQKILIDCGLFQGKKELRLRNWDEFPIKGNEIDLIVLTHAHLDHSGYIPKLKKEGFNGPIYCTKPTADLLELLWMDCAKLMEEDAEYAEKKGFSSHSNPKPLYTSTDVEAVLPQIQGYFFEQEITINNHIHIKFHNAGHIIGASIVEVFLFGERQDKKLVFSGDLGRLRDPILHPPKVIKEADILFVESTYGNRANTFKYGKHEIARIVKETFKRGGCVLIPAFAIGRTQNILIYLKELMENKEIPVTDIFMDSPMGINATKVYGQNNDFHKLDLKNIQAEDSFFKLNKHIKTIKSHEDSVSLNNLKKSAIIISSSGMMTGGRILHHLYNRLPRKNDTILIVGFQAAGTRGRKLIENEPEISIFGQMIEVNAHVEFVDGLSAHADLDELMFWLEGFEESPKMTFIIHGEKDASTYFSRKIEHDLGWNTIVPDYQETFELFKGI